MRSLYIIKWLTTSCFFLSLSCRASSCSCVGNHENTLTSALHTQPHTSTPPHLHSLTPALLTQHTSIHSHSLTPVLHTQHTSTLTQPHTSTPPFDHTAALQVVNLYRLTDRAISSTCTLVSATRIYSLDDSSHLLTAAKSKREQCGREGVQRRRRREAALCRLAPR